MSPVIITLDRKTGVWKLDIPIPPTPASRPRLGGRSIFYSKNYTTFRKRASVLTPKKLPSCFPLMGALEVWTTLHVLRPRTTKKLWPRGDTDNYEKGVWDAITNWQIWGDDDQIVINHTRKVFAVDIPHIEVLIKQIEVAKWKQSS